MSTTEAQAPVPLRDRLTPEQWATLLAPLNPERVNVLDGNDYLEQWDVRRWLIRVFGPGGWDLTVLDLTLLREHGVEQSAQQGKAPKWRWWVSYRATVRLTVRDQYGVTLGSYDGTAADEKANQPGHGDAHHGAATSAESTALKRAALNLGDAFGLSLYSKVAFDKRAGKSLAVVAWSAVRPPERPADAQAKADAAQADAVPAPAPDPHEETAPGQPDDFASADAALAQQADGYAQLVDQCHTKDDLTAIWQDAHDAGLLAVLLDPARGHVNLQDYIGAAGKRLPAEPVPA